MTDDQDLTNETSTGDVDLDPETGRTVGPEGASRPGEPGTAEGETAPRESEPGPAASG